MLRPVIHFRPRGKQGASARGDKEAHRHREVAARSRCEQDDKTSSIPVDLSRGSETEMTAEIATWRQVGGDFPSSCLKNLFQHWVGTGFSQCSRASSSVRERSQHAQMSPSARLGRFQQTACNAANDVPGTGASRTARALRAPAGHVPIRRGSRMMTRHQNKV
jgi:hypothetical protein